ncbi:MAG: cytochrome c [Thermomicrobiales bacterium]|nr:cytochrome c [Thermomicrobiales bacterium]
MMAALAGAYSVIAQNTTPTPGASASPSASPAASPVASPIASPVALVGDVEAGKTLAAQCLGCHTTDGSTMVGPTWKGLYGHQVELEDGSTVVADDAYLAASIRDPMSQIVKGFPPAMPPYSYLTDQQIADLIAYIKSLE